MLEKIKDNFEFNKVNKILLVTIFLLLIVGLFTFLSASIGVLGRNEIKFYNILEGQMKAYVIGIIAMIIAFSVPYIYYFRLVPYIFGASIVLASLVLVPGIGVNHGGATRWLDIGGFSLQPSEILKFTTILMTAWFIKKYYNKLGDYKFSIGIYGGILCIIGALMMLQKDIGSLLIIAGSSFVIYFVSGARWRHMLVFVLLGLVAVSLYAIKNPYIIDRINVFKKTDTDKLGSSYQTRQALIAVGSGGVLGRGPGQSIQKFSYLPEPIGDSIFAVNAEEFGLVGSSLIVILFAILIITSLRVAIKKKEYFGRSIIIGIAGLMFLQTILNIASMIAIIPLSGDILPFFSQGGTALIINLFEIGLLLQLTKRNFE